MLRVCLLVLGVLEARSGRLVDVTGSIVVIFTNDSVANVSVRIPPPRKFQDPLRQARVGLRKTDNLANLESRAVLTPEAWPIPPLNNTGVEIFLGESHRSKNTGDQTKAYKLDDPNEADIDKASELPRPQQGKVTVYGTDHCRFSRRTKALLRLVGADFDFINLADFGGPKSAFAVLKKEDLMPEGHKTMPAVFSADGSFLGGYPELKYLYPHIDEAGVQRATPPAPVPHKIESTTYDSAAIVSIPKIEQWAPGKEEMAALVDGAELILSANFINAPDGVSLYVECSPGSIQVVGERKDIEFSGRHFLRSYNYSNPRDITLTFAKGMEVSLLGVNKVLTLEPRAESV